MPIVHQGSALIVGLRAEDVLDPYAYQGFGPVGPRGLLGQRLAEIALELCGNLGDGVI